MKNPVIGSVTQALFRVLVAVGLTAAGVSLIGSSPAAAGIGACTPFKLVTSDGHSFRRCGVPDFDQLRDDLPEGGAMYCVPTSALNWMAYIADRGLPGMPPGPGLTNPAVDASEYELIGESIHAMGVEMKTDPVAGSGEGVYDGLVSWIAQSGTKDFDVHWSYPVEFGDALEVSPTVESIAATAAQGSLTMLNLGWWERDEASTRHIRKGGHMVSLVGADPEWGGEPNAYRILINDPASALGDPDDAAALSTQSPYWTDGYTTDAVKGSFKEKDDKDYAQSVKAGIGGSAEGGLIDGAYFITPKFILAPDPATDGWTFSFPADPEHVELVQAGSMPEAVDAELAPFGSEHLVVFGSGDIERVNGVDGSRRPFLNTPEARRARFDDHNRVVVLARGELLRFLNDGTADPDVRVPVPTDSDEIAYDPFRKHLVGWDRETNTLTSYGDDLQVVDQQQLPPFDLPPDPDTPVSLSIHPKNGTIGLLVDGTDQLVVVTPARTVAQIRLGNGEHLAGLVADSSGVWYSTGDDSTVRAFDQTGAPVEGTPFDGVRSGRLFRIWQPMNIGEPPSGVNILPKDIARAATTTTVAALPDPSTVGGEVTITARVTAAEDSTPTGQVAFRDGAELLGTSMLDSNGVATFTASDLAPGAHTLTARYGGDLVHDESAGSVTHIVGRIRTQLEAQPALFRLSPLAPTLRLSATLEDASGMPLAGKQVRFEVGGRTMCTGVTGRDGVASCQDPTALLLALLGLGYRAVFDGDGSHAPSAAWGPIIR